jgi:hypothetical protein
MIVPLKDGARPCGDNPDGGGSAIVNLKFFAGFDQCLDLGPTSFHFSHTDDIHALIYGMFFKMKLKRILFDQSWVEDFKNSFLRSFHSSESISHSL